jgi:hypothetical protein
MEKTKTPQSARFEQKSLAALWGERGQSIRSKRMFVNPKYSSKYQPEPQVQKIDDESGG